MIWIVGSGPRTYQICQKLNELKIDYKLTTITDYNRDMPLSYTSKALYKPLNLIEMQDFIKKESIRLIIDHTYGTAHLLSKELMQASEEEKSLYVRYEEPTLLDKMSERHNNIRVITTKLEIEQVLKDYNRPIFLDVNRKCQKDIADLNLEKCFDRTATMTDAEVQQMIKENDISAILIGEEKDLSRYIAICKTLELPLIVIKKDKLQYKNRCYTLEALEEYLH